MGRTHFSAVTASVAMALGIGCAGTDVSEHQHSTDGGTAGAGGTANGTAGAGGAVTTGSPDATGATSDGGRASDGCEGFTCRDGNVVFGPYCADGYTHCDPAISGGVTCMPDGPCPSGNVDAAADAGDGCASVDTTSDPANCGTCGNRCGPFVLASAQSYTNAIATDGESVYWTSDEGGAVMKAPRGGGTPVTLVPGQKNVYSTDIAVDGTSVYWITEGVETDTTLVMSVPRGGGTPVTLASTQGPPQSFSFPHIAVDGANVYWTTGDRYTTGATDSIMKVPLGGGTAVTLASAPTNSYSSDIAVDGTSVYWTTNDRTSQDAGSVMKLSLGGGTPTTLASGQPGARAIAVDATSVYWITGNGYFDGAIMKAPLGGGEPIVLASRQAEPSALAVDATSVYWINGGAIWTGAGFFDGSIARVPLTGGRPVTLASNQRAPVAVVVGATSVYWATHVFTDGAVLSFDKDACRSGACQ